MASIDSIILRSVFVQVLRPRFFQIGIHWFGELLQSFLNLNSPFYKPNFYFGKSLKLKTFFCLWDFTGNQFLQFWGRKNCQFERFYKILISFFVNYSFRKLSKFHKVHNQVLELLPNCQIKGFLRFTNFSKLISRKIWMMHRNILKFPHRVIVWNSFQFSFAFVVNSLQITRLDVYNLTKIFCLYYNPQQICILNKLD